MLVTLTRNHLKVGNFWEFLKKLSDFIFWARYLLLQSKVFKSMV